MSKTIKYYKPESSNIFSNINNIDNVTSLNPTEIFLIYIVIRKVIM
jgi:hypothetical protein